MFCLEIIPNYPPSSSVWGCLCPQALPIWCTGLYNLCQSPGKWKYFVTDFPHNSLIMNEVEHFLNCLKVGTFSSMNCLICALCPFKKMALFAFSYWFVGILCDQRRWILLARCVLYHFSQLYFHLLEYRDWNLSLFVFLFLI